jgi:phenylpropionate dioxygenase-like ring-hydroxylating dioxygenase large terminal subunit
MGPFKKYPSFEKESQEALDGVWFFIGLSNQLPNNGDYLIRKIYDEELIVRNSNGNIKAFLNRCIHRGAPIFNHMRGNSTIKCQFHGWSYDDNGKVSGIPFNEYYYHLDKNCENLRLIEYPIERIGKFIFMNFSPEPPAINAQFSENIFALLDEISQYLDDYTSVSDIEADCNWKYLYEITIDPLHVPFVHSQTLNKLRPFKPEKIPIKVITNNKSSLSELSVAYSQARDPVNVYPWRQNVKRWQNKDIYLDVLIFPNLHLVSPDGGFCFSWEAYFPLNYQSTKIEYGFATAKRTSNFSYLPIIHLESMREGIKIYLEDIEMAEKLQKKQSSIYDRTMPGSYEEEIYKFRNFFRSS